jgi:anthranilate/para-aminobenzoate synthase component I
LTHSTSPINPFFALEAQNDYYYMLKSAEGSRKLMQYSFIQFSPVKVREVLAESFKTYDRSRFVGGLVSHSYDVVSNLVLPAQVREDLNFPDAEFGVCDDEFVFDQLTSQAYKKLKGLVEFSNGYATKLERMTVQVA